MGVSWILLLFFITNCHGQGSSDFEVTCNMMCTTGLVVCEDDDSMAFWDASGVTHSMINESMTAIDGKLLVYKDLPCSVTMTFEIYSLNNKRKELVATQLVDFYKELEDGTGPNVKYYEALGLEPNCPREAGPMEVQNLMLSKDDMPLSPSNQGPYQIVASLKDGDVFLACLNLHIFIECD